jgi:hypothetical protein
MKRVPSLALLVALSSTVSAEIYKHVDEHGNVTYSNIPMKGAQKLNLGLPSGPSAPKSGAKASPAGFPKVDAATQRKRDDMRRRVLQEELAAEEANRAEAFAALKAGEGLRPGELKTSPSYLDRQQRMRDALTLHEKNIEALKKELSHVR